MRFIKFASAFVLCSSLHGISQLPNSDAPGALKRIQFEEELQKSEHKSHRDEKIQLLGPTQNMLAATGASLNEPAARDAFLQLKEPAALTRLGFTNIILVDGQQNSWLSLICQDHYSALDQVVEHGHPQSKATVRLELAPRMSCNGLQIDSVFPGGASDQAGIKPGDLLDSVAGIKVPTTYSMLQALAGKHPGDSVDVTVYRDGRAIVKKVVLTGESGTAPVSPWPTAYKRRDYQLGILLSQFKYMPYPDDNPTATINPGCSDDPKLALDLTPSKSVVSCSFFDQSAMFPTSTGLSMGDIFSQTKFFFISKDGVEEPRLFMIFSDGPSERFSELVDTFTSGFGKPTKITHNTFQKKSGSTFPNTTIIWENEVSIIQLENFGESTLKYRVTHSLKPLLGAYMAAIDKENAEKARKL